jgi:hypothetical protein
MMIKIEIPEYNKEEGIKMSWEKGFIVESQNNGESVIIKANKEGLVSLAIQLLTLAQDSIPKGYHMHYDESNSLENGSCEVIIEKF